MKLLKLTFVISLIFLSFHPVFAGDTLTFCFLGDSRSDGKEGLDGINKPVLSGLCTQIKNQNPLAVFFSGDLTLGLEKEDDITDSTDNKDEEDLLGSSWYGKGFKFDPISYSRQLSTFSSILSVNLGEKIPFYPVIGNHEAVGPEAISIFRNHFAISNCAPIDSMHLAYSVEMNDCLFIVIATDYYDRSKKKLVEHEISTEQLEWIENTLKNSQAKYKFVIGHEPAYSLKELKKGKPAGLDKYPASRDAFWETLQNNNVTAYICSHQHLYNASKYGGVWQIISGGAGAPLKKHYDDAFYHYLLMKIPSIGEAPHLSVIDSESRTRYEFSLN